MATIELTQHLYQFFPALAGRSIEVPAATVADAVAAVEALAPGFAFYVCDERGRLRQHVNIFVAGKRITDRATLTDPVPTGARIHILQALSGG
jgi:predicted phage tail protein